MHGMWIGQSRCKRIDLEHVPFDALSAVSFGGTNGLPIGIAAHGSDAQLHIAPAYRCYSFLAFALATIIVGTVCSCRVSKGADTI